MIRAYAFQSGVANVDYTFTEPTGVPFNPAGNGIEDALSRSARTRAGGP